MGVWQEKHSGSRKTEIRKLIKKFSHSKQEIFSREGDFILTCLLYFTGKGKAETKLLQKLIIVFPAKKLELKNYNNKYYDFKQKQKPTIIRLTQGAAAEIKVNYGSVVVYKKGRITSQLN